MVFWTIATWVRTPINIVLFGFNGVAVASAIIGLSFIVVVMVVKKYISFEIFPIIRVPLLATVVMSLVIFFLSSLLVSNLIWVFVMIVLGGILYVGIVYLF